MDIQYNTIGNSIKIRNNIAENIAQPFLIIYLLILLDI